MKSSFEKDYLAFDKKRYLEKLEEFFDRQKKPKEPERKVRVRSRPTR